MSVSKMARRMGALQRLAEQVDRIMICLHSADCPDGEHHHPPEVSMMIGEQWYTAFLEPGDEAADGAVFLLDRLENPAEWPEAWGPHPGIPHPLPYAFPEISSDSGGEADVPAEPAAEPSPMDEADYNQHF